MQYIKWLGLLIMTIVLAGCIVVVDQPEHRQQQLATSSVWDIPVAIPAGSSFTLSPNYLEQVSKKYPEIKDVYQLYHQAITKSFHQQGFDISQAPADFNVVYGIALSDELTDEMISQHFGVTPGLQGNSELEKGSFLIYVEDAKSKEKIWRGAVQGFVLKDISKSQRIDRTNKIVNMVLVQFLNAG